MSITKDQFIDNIIQYLPESSQTTQNDDGLGTVIYMPDSEFESLRKSEEMYYIREYTKDLAEKKMTKDEVIKCLRNLMAITGRNKYYYIPDFIKKLENED